MCSCRRSVYVHQVILLTAIQLVCLAFNCSCTTSNESTATHPNTHPAQHVTTSTTHVWQSTTAVARMDFANDSIVSSSRNSSDFSIKNETSTRINNSSVYVAETDDISSSGQDNTATAEHQVLDHVSSLSLYTSPTSESPGHVTNATNDSAATEKTGSYITTDVNVTSSRGDHSNGVTKNTQMTSQETTVSVSAGGSSAAWEIPTTNVELRTSRGGNETLSDQLMTSSVTSPSLTSRHFTRDLIDRGKPRVSVS